MRRLPILLLGLLFASLANADVTLAPLFCDGAVLQQEKTVPVWGTAAAGESVTVTFADQSATATAEPDGTWMVRLKPLIASSEPRDLTIVAGNKLVVHDVIVGEVWLVSGQSHMAYPLSGIPNIKAEILATNFPLLRQFKVAMQSSFTPLPTVNGTWEPAMPNSVGQFTAVGYYFALYLHQKLSVPVGIINSTLSATGIETWIPPDSYRANPSISKYFFQQEKLPHATPAEITAYYNDFSAWEKARIEAKASKQLFAGPAPKPPANPPGPRTIAGLYNGMIAPLVPYALRGAIWYQGEANAGQAALYPPRLAALITGWRKQFGQGDFPFYWVQLPKLDVGGATQTNCAQLREAQTKILSLPNTAQAVTLDVAEEKIAPPRTKKTIGERLALLALARTYGDNGVLDSGPVILTAKLIDSVYTLTFEPSRSALTAGSAGITGFELAGADQVFHPAEAKIEGDTLLVASSDVTAPVALRYAYRNSPETGLFNAEGLPAAPFRTDTW